VKTIRGQFAHHLNPAAVNDGWRNRFASVVAPEARLETSGTKFSIRHSPNWDIASLKHSFELEVHRIDPGCEVTWSGS
jgi:hypothetical protein